MDENLKTISLGISLLIALGIIGFLGYGHGLQYLGIAPAPVPSASEVGLGGVDQYLIGKVSVVVLLIVAATILFLERDSGNVKPVKEAGQ